MEIVARGVRNTVGFDWHPVTKELWFTDHGRDWMGNDSPQDELNRIAKGQEGANFGYPCRHPANGVPDADIRRPNPCAGVVLPAAMTGPHAAGLGIMFYTGDMFPANYKNAAFIARGIEPCAKVRLRCRAERSHGDCARDQAGHDELPRTSRTSTTGGRPTSCRCRTARSSLTSTMARSIKAFLFLQRIDWQAERGMESECTDRLEVAQSPFGRQPPRCPPVAGSRKSRRSPSASSSAAPATGRTATPARKTSRRSLASQVFLLNALVLMREGVRRVEVMVPLVRDLRDHEIAALARHFAALPPRAKR